MGRINLCGAKKNFVGGIFKKWRKSIMALFLFRSLFYHLSHKDFLNGLDGYRVSGQFSEKGSGFLQI